VETLEYMKCFDVSGEEFRNAKEKVNRGIDLSKKCQERVC